MLIGVDTHGVLFPARRLTLSLAAVASAGFMRSVVAVLSGEAAGAVEDGMVGRMAVTADMWVLAGSGGTSGGTVEP